MKNVVIALFLFTNLSVFAQKPCEIDTNVTDSLGTYKSLKQCVIYERHTENNIDVLFGLFLNNGVLGVEAQILEQSNGFIKANCFSVDSRIYLQLNNGKIVTLLYASEETCGTYVRDEKNGSNRITVGRFVFSKENFEELKVSPVTFMRIKYATETIDYPFKTEIISELDKKTYQPENYFIDYIKCIEN